MYQEKFKKSFQHSGFKDPGFKDLRNQPLLKKEDNKRMNDDDDAGDPSILHPEFAQFTPDYKEPAIPSVSEPDVTVTKTNGTTLTMCQSTIYRHFLKLPQYPTEVIKQAIHRIQKVEGPVNNILKYLESTCAQILTESKPLNKTKKPAKPYTVPKEEKVVVHKPTITMAEFLKRKQEAKDASR